MNSSLLFLFLKIMKNIEYLEQFFRKHDLKGKIKVKYDKSGQDDYMTDIIFENGDVMNINDVIFDIESDLEPDVVKQWLKSKKDNDVSLMEWIQTDNHYMPEFDNTAMKEYQREIELMWNDAKEKIDRMFELQDDDDE